MKRIDVSARIIDVKDLKRRHAIEEDAEILIDEDVIIYEDGIPILLYMQIDWIDTTDLLNACKKIKYVTDTRLPKKYKPGMVTRSAIFGYKPRVPLRNDFCSATSLSKNQPEEHAKLVSFAAELMHVYETYFPEVFAMHKEMVEEKVKREWVIADSVFTSGIVNFNNPLPYHHDTGNFKNVLSNMVAFRNGISGGYLVLPEYNIKLKIADNTLSIFDGQKIVHGVSSFKKYKQDAYRYTIVYYSLEQMWKCEKINDEVQRIRNVRVEREKKRANLNHKENE